MAEIVLPMSVLALWTLLVLLLVPIVRIRAVRARRVAPKDFRYGESANVPGDVSLPNRDYMNLLELPVLFYAACLVILASNRYDHAGYTLAWAFVATRIVHSVIHLTYNNVLHRLLAFGAGVLIVATMWINLLLWVLDKMCAFGNCH
jgi:hypothetical protein